MLHSRRDRDGQRGQIIVLFELCLVVILGCAALVIDLGLLRNNRQILVNSLDSAALAAGSQLPVTGLTGPLGDGANGATTANTLINANIQANFPGLPTSATALGSRCVSGVDPSISNCAYSIVYKCLIGADATGPLISRDVPAACDPRISLGIPLDDPLTAGDIAALASAFKGAGSTRISACNPSLGDKCNVVVITGSETTRYSIGPVVGVNSGSTGTIVAAACNGACGQPPVVPVDLVIILDRTGSMADGSNNSGPKIQALQTAAKAVLGVYDPAKQRVALGLTGPGAVDASGNPTLNSCPAGGTAYGTADDGNMVPTTTLSGAATTVCSKATTVSGATTTVSGATTLNGALTKTTSPITVASKTGFPTTFPFTIQVDSEQMSVTASPSGTTWTVTRHINSTTAAAHSSGAGVYLIIANTATTINVATAAGFPTTGSYYIQIGAEQMQVTGGQGTTTWTVLRAQNGTVATTQNGGLTVSEVVGKTQTTIDVASAIGFPPSGNFTIKVDSEQMTVTGGQGTTTWTVVRGANGTATATHSIGAAVSWVLGTNDTTIYVASETGFPALFPFTIKVDSEQMQVTGNPSATTWTVVRGQNGTTKATHSGGASVIMVISKTDTTIQIASAIGIPTSGGPFRIEIDNEQMQANVWGTPDTTTVLSVTRAQYGTGAATHAVGAQVNNLTGWTTDPTNVDVAATAGVWIPVGLSGTDVVTPPSTDAPPNPSGAAGTYEIAGTPNPSSTIVKAIGCIQAASNGTTLAMPLAYAKWYLDTYGRQGVTKGILLETDGHPQDGGNFVNGLNLPQFTCTAAIAAAKAAKDEGIKVYAVGYGISGTCGGDSPSNSSEGNTGMSAATLLQTLATGTTAPYYFNAPSGAALASNFRQIAADLAHTGAHLIQLYPTPIVTSAGGATSSVTISGQYFTGAISVTFGGTSATVNTLTDTTILATAPAKPSGTVVDVVVTTPGGLSAITSADKYTYP
jgi:hypothetical protein